MSENIFMIVGGEDEEDVLKQDLKDQTKRRTSGFGCSKIKRFLLKEGVYRQSSQGARDI